MKEEELKSELLELDGEIVVLDQYLLNLKLRRKIVLRNLEEIKKEIKNV